MGTLALLNRTLRYGPITKNDVFLLMAKNLIKKMVRPNYKLSGYGTYLVRPNFKKS